LLDHQILYITAPSLTPPPTYITNDRNLIAVLTNQLCASGMYL